MDAAGTVVGIASLGIQACQGLLSYYNDWKGYRLDIDRVHKSTEDLHATLELLEAALLNDRLDTKQKEHVREGLESCRDALATLKRRADKVGTYQPPDELGQKIRDGVRRLIYPFQVSTLKRLRAIVNDVLTRLQLATHVLQLDFSKLNQVILERIDDRILNVEKRLNAEQQSDEFREIVNWLSPPDPWTNHFLARAKHEPETGNWFLASDTYRNWKDGTGNRHIWLHGTAGCGKTVLCSTAIQDVWAHCKSHSHDNIGVGIFYLAFSDKDKQTIDDLLRSLLEQLAWKEPGLSMLRQSYKRPGRNVPGKDELEHILLSSLKSYQSVYLMVDALDESPDTDDIRQDLLNCIERLAQSAPQLRLFATSRATPEIRESMAKVKADPIKANKKAINADIEKYVNRLISRHAKLSRLQDAMKDMIRDTISRKAGGMFRWAYCQLQELGRLKSFKPSLVQSTLEDLPDTLGETYSRMLAGVEGKYRKDAVTLLQWLAYARSPPTLGELADAVVIDVPSGTVKTEDRPDLESTLEILSGLVTVVEAESYDDFDGHDQDSQRQNSSPSASASTSDSCSDSEDYSSYDPLAYPRRQTRVRLAHSSIKEYLESDRTLEDPTLKSAGARYHLDFSTGHELLAQSCLIYLRHYSDSTTKTSDKQDHTEFPLLRYAARSWHYHSSLQRRDADIGRELSLLTSQRHLSDWILVHQPDHANVDISGSRFQEKGSALYYAALLALDSVVLALLENGAEVNAQGGHLRNALQAASVTGHVKTMRILLEHGADVNVWGGYHGNALQAATIRGHAKAVRLLLDHGADVNVKGQWYGNPLHLASAEGHIEIVRMLLDCAAKVNAQGGWHGNALVAASLGGHVETARLLLEHGANINARGPDGNELEAAMQASHAELVQLLLDWGGDSYGPGDLGNALRVASQKGFARGEQLLLAHGADVSIPLTSEDQSDEEEEQR